MADQKINELPTKTAPSTGDKMLMIGAAEEYQIDYDKLASAILDKLATKQYSELDTTAKTVLGALDELNSKMPVSAYQYGIEIPQNADMNTYKTPGKFVSANSSVTSTLENSPFSDSSFRLEVRSMIDPNNGASIQQIAYPGNMNKFKRFAIRTFLNTVWSDWIYFSGDTTRSI